MIVTFLAPPSIRVTFNTAAPAVTNMVGAPVGIGVGFSVGVSVGAAVVGTGDGSAEGSAEILGLGVGWSKRSPPATQK